MTCYEASMPRSPSMSNHGASNVKRLVTLWMSLFWKSFQNFGIVCSGHITRTLEGRSKSHLMLTFELFTKAFKPCMVLPWRHLLRPYENCARNGPISTPNIRGTRREKEILYSARHKNQRTTNPSADAAMMKWSWSKYS